MEWNKDDNKIPYPVYKEFLDDFDKQENQYTFYSYNKGGHEFNSNFVKK